MATPNYNINYNDERFKTVESEKQTALNQINDTYNNMISQSDKFYQDQIDAAKDYAEIQKQNQQANTDFAIEKIEQQKDQAHKDYVKEQTGAYVDWQKQSNQYGANAEQMAASGLNNTGYSESSQVSMYNTYQNRVATARESFNKAVLDYDNAIKDAQLQNNSALAEIAYNALQAQLELSLQGFQYKNDLLQVQIQQQQNTEDRYYSRWQDVLNQMNTENQLKESIRQYEQNLAYQKERDKIADEQWQKEYNLSLASRSSSGGSSGGGSSYSSGVVAYGTLVNSYGDGSGNIIYVDSNGNTYKMKAGYNPYTGTKNSDVSNGTFSNGYQPNNVNGDKLSSTGTKATVNGQAQNIWQTKVGQTTKYYVWDGTTNKYKSLSSSKYKKIKNGETVEI